MIRAQDLTLRAGGFELRSLSFEIAAGDYAVLMGRTGSGKTTLLESIVGLRRVEAGQLWIAGNEVTDLRPSERGIGYVPQDGALFPTLNVRDHLAFALRVRGQSQAEIAPRVDELSRQLGIHGLLDRRPAGLSGGERQRVALGRALAFRPGVLLLDEPLSALDEDTRDQMCEVLESVHRSSGTTILHVTHRRDESLRLGDTVLELEAGNLRSLPPSTVSAASPASTPEGQG